MLSKMETPLTHLIRKDVKFKWTSECKENFNKLKHWMVTPLIHLMQHG